MEQVDIKLERPDGGMEDFTSEVARVPVAGDVLDVGRETYEVVRVLFSVKTGGQSTPVPLATAQPTSS